MITTKNDNCNGNDNNENNYDKSDNENDDDNKFRTFWRNSYFLVIFGSLGFIQWN